VSPSRTLARLPHPDDDNVVAINIDLDDLNIDAMLIA